MRCGPPPSREAFDAISTATGSFFGEGAERAGRPPEVTGADLVLLQNFSTRLQLLQLFDRFQLLQHKHVLEKRGVGGGGGHPGPSRASGFKQLFDQRTRVRLPPVQHKLDTHYADE